MLMMSFADFERAYTTQLSRLDPNDIWFDLHRLAGGAEPVLQCFEKPPIDETNFCHRRMVAEWFEKSLDVKVSELE